MVVSLFSSLIFSQTLWYRINPAAFWTGAFPIPEHTLEFSSIFFCFSLSRVAGVKFWALLNSKRSEFSIAFLCCPDCRVNPKELESWSETHSRWKAAGTQQEAPMGQFVFCRCCARHLCVCEEKGLKSQKSTWWEGMGSTSGFLVYPEGYKTACLKQS